MSASMNIPNPHHELRGQLQDLLQDPPISASLPNMHPLFPSSPLSREYRTGVGSPMHAAAPRDRSMPITPSGLHPFMASHSGNPSPLHTSAPLSPAHSPRPPLYLPTGSSSQGVDESRRSDRERRRADRAAARRPSPPIVPETRPTPMLRPQSHNTVTTPPLGSSAQPSSAVHPPMPRPQLPHRSSSQRLPSSSIPSSSSDALSAQSSSGVHPSMPRPQLPHRSSSQRLPPSPIPPSGSDAMPMPRPQTHNAPHPSPSIPNPPNAQQQQPARMPRARAHAAPSPATDSASQPHTQPSPPPSHGPAAYAPAPASPASQVPSRHAPEDAYASSPTRGGHSGTTRGISKHILPHAMAPTNNASMLYAV
ncbi:hypothetical protein DFH08DRAFT_896074 [Mycena albidolilacea]|uniref:Uncharacterized protein n=1 Tax=Mycena albidolilacea TaxID=1033008 RepID=A0AAD6ZAL0_9AGAR|nr:hypothetical protein DFH08DRAFT_896074 [Mycena albidolilacea]